MRINGRIFFILLFLCGVGICTGSFFELGLSEEAKSALSAALRVIFQGYIGTGSADAAASELNDSGVFFSSFIMLAKAAVAPLILGFASAALVFLLPLLPLYVMLRGISIGLSSTMLLETFGAKGVLYIMLTLMPQNVIQIPICCLLCTLSMQLGRLFAAAFLPKLLPDFIKKGFPHLQKLSQNRSSKKILQANARSYLAFYLLGVLLLIGSCAIQACLLPLAF